MPLIDLASVSMKTSLNLIHIVSIVSNNQSNKCINSQIFRNGRCRCYGLQTTSDTASRSQTFQQTEDSLALNPLLPVDSVESNLFQRFWSSYLSLLRENPILAKSLTSLFGFMIGDICAQSIIAAHYDLYRTLRLTAFGVLMDGPIGHCWYLLLDQNVLPETPTVPKTIIIKTALDQLLWAPFFSCVFFTFNQILQGHPELALPTIQEALIPTLMANYVLWPLAHIINFKFIPSDQRILYINVVQILWTSYLSNLAAHSTTLKVAKNVHQHLIHHSHHASHMHSIVHKLHFG